MDREDRYKVKYDREDKQFYIEESGIALNWSTPHETKAGRYCARLNKAART